MKKAILKKKTEVLILFLDGLINMEIIIIIELNLRLLVEEKREEQENRINQEKLEKREEQIKKEENQENKIYKNNNRIYIIIYLCYFGYFCFML